MSERHTKSNRPKANLKVSGKVGLVSVMRSHPSRPAKSMTFHLSLVSGGSVLISNESMHLRRFQFYTSKPILF